jgi:hypothetical protein
VKLWLSNQTWYAGAVALGAKTSRSTRPFVAVALVTEAVTARDPPSAIVDGATDALVVKLGAAGGAAVGAGVGVGAGAPGVVGAAVPVGPGGAVTTEVTGGGAVGVGRAAAGAVTANDVAFGFDE